MKTVIREILAQCKPNNEYHLIREINEQVSVELIHQLLCDCMATAMYRCMEHMPLDKQGLARVRLAEYGFSKGEIEQSITKLENE